MGTRVDKRNESPIQFIDTAKELVAHTWCYIHKFPKSVRFTISVRVNDLAIEIYENVVKANTIFLRKDNIADKEEKRKYLLNALGALNSLEGILSIAQPLYNTYITDYGWLHWGELISKERQLLVGLLKTLN